MSDASRPNLLIVMADQLRRDALSCYGDPNVSTPHIDRLAARGVRFEAAVASYPICVPFRFSFMTGQHAHTRLVPALEFRLSPGERTIADEFNDAGYHTVYVGKWHLDGGGPMQPIPRSRRGRWAKWLGFELRNSHFDTFYFEDDDPTPKPLNRYQTDGLFDLTMRYLENDRPPDQPFCCVLSVEPPHFPYEAPPELEAKWRDRELKLPPSFMARPDYELPLSDWPNDRDEDRAKKLRNLRTYYAMIENLDANVGRLTDWLARTGLAENTIVVFLADHGETGGRHDLPTAMKAYPFEHSNGIPLIVVDPRQADRAGATVAEPVVTEDFYPTLCGLAGIEPAARLGPPLPGADVTPLIRGEAEALERDGVLLEVVRDHRPLGAFFRKVYRGLRTRRWKYTVLGPPRGPGRPWQLFDLDADPHEMHNLIDDPAQAETRDRLHAALADRLAATDDSFTLAE